MHISALKNALLEKSVTPISILQYLPLCWRENALDTLKLIFYIRDCRGGLGEKELFYTSIRWMARYSPETRIVLIKNFPYIPHYGCYKDFMALCGTCVEDEMLEFYAYCLERDRQNMLSNNIQLNVSFAAKYAPTERQHYDIRFQAAKKLARKLGVSMKTYRTDYLSPLRNKLNIIETKMCGNLWSEIDIKDTSMYVRKKYTKAFERHSVGTTMNTQVDPQINPITDAINSCITEYFDIDSPKSFSVSSITEETVHDYDDFVNIKSGCTTTINSPDMKAVSFINTRVSSVCDTPCPSPINKITLNSAICVVDTSLSMKAYHTSEKPGALSLLQFASACVHIITKLSGIKKYMTFSTTPRIINMNNCTSGLARNGNIHTLSPMPLACDTEMWIDFEETLRVAETISEVNHVFVFSDEPFDNVKMYEYLTPEMYPHLTYINLRDRESIRFLVDLIKPASEGRYSELSL